MVHCDKPSNVGNGFFNTINGFCFVLYKPRLFFNPTIIIRDCIGYD